ncbi:MAG: hypothetical protein ACTFAL_06060 [Candidatus Electronema sp. V4]|uniref:hypothetical protein n=1 Tax=Candidatus Electronema sp. V4 TaxID=3454756 RepID=UPI00405591CF
MIGRSRAVENAPPRRRAVCRSTVDLPAMFGPVMITSRTKPGSLREPSLGQSTYDL